MANEHSTLSFRLKWGLWYGAYLVAGLCISPGLIVFFWFLPAGLIEVFSPGSFKGGTTDHTSRLLVLGWLPYVALTLAAYLTHRRNRFFIIYAVFCALLVFNVVGCRSMFIRP